MKVTEQASQHDLFAGDQHMFSSSSRSDIESFVIGMALTFHMIGPEEVPGFVP